MQLWAGLLLALRDMMLLMRTSSKSVTLMVQLLEQCHYKIVCEVLGAFAAAANYTLYIYIISEVRRD